MDLLSKTIVFHLKKFKKLKNIIKFFRIQTQILQIHPASQAASQGWSQAASQGWLPGWLAGRQAGWQAGWTWPGWPREAGLGGWLGGLAGWIWGIWIWISKNFIIFLIF